MSAQLFGDLGGIHTMHGPGEAYAHLEHLVGAGVAVRSEDQYALIDLGASVDDLF